MRGGDGERGGRTRQLLRPVAPKRPERSNTSTAAPLGRLLFLHAECAQPFSALPPGCAAQGAHGSAVLEFDAGGDLGSKREMFGRAELHRGRVPERRCAVLARGRRGPAVRAQGDRANPSPVLERRADQDPRGDVPAPRRRVEAPGQGRPPVGPKATSRTSSRCWRDSPTCSPVSAFQNRAVRSRLPLTSSGAEPRW